MLRTFRPTRLSQRVTPKTPRYNPNQVKTTSSQTVPRDREEQTRVPIQPLHELRHINLSKLAMHAAASTHDLKISCKNTHNTPRSIPPTDHDVYVYACQACISSHANRLSSLWSCPPQPVDCHGISSHAESCKEGFPALLVRCCLEQSQHVYHGHPDLSVRCHEPAVLHLHDTSHRSAVTAVRL